MIILRNAFSLSLLVPTSPAFDYVYGRRRLTPFAFHTIRNMCTILLSMFRVREDFDTASVVTDGIELHIG